MTFVAFAESQEPHDEGTNYDGYGSANNRCQNMIMLMTHDSILKAGKMKYWDSLDDYSHKKNSSKKNVSLRHGKVCRHR